MLPADPPNDWRDNHSRQEQTNKHRDRHHQVATTNSEHLQKAIGNTRK
jgi:hypothetical protein